MRNSSFFVYGLALVASVGLMLWILNVGDKLPASGDLVVAPVPGPVESGNVLWNSPLAMLLLQIVVILLVVRIFLVLTARFGQPPVIGEILAGLIVGPSLLGLLFPEASAWLFPSESLGNLYLLSQVGLILFMFIMGMELDIRVLRTQAKATIFVSNVGIIIPMLAGMGLAYFLYTEYAQNGATFQAFALLTALSLTVTAFPSLLRIVQERGWYKTPLGSMAITSAAAIDIAVWCMLAAVVAMVRAGGFAAAAGPVVMGTVYVVLMLTVVKPLMHKVGSVYASKEIFNKRVVGLILLVLVASSYAAEVIGIHSLFGAFLAGVAMPHNLSFKKIITEKFEDISLVFLLPVFFILTGLRTDITLLNTASHWGIFAALLLVAVAFKFGSIALAGRMSGLNARDALSLGVLLNTRGLMELVIINIGYELGVFSAEIFTMLVLMTIATTMLTTPALNVLDRLFAEDDFGARVLARIRTSFRILLSFGPPKMGSTLIRLADQLTLKHNRNVDITALHITPSYDIKPYEALLYEKEAFQPIRSTAQLLGLRINTLYKNTEEVDKEIISTVSQGRFDLVLVGAARPIFTEKATGGVLRQLLEGGETNIGVLIDRGFVMAESILLLLGSEDDLALLEYAYRFRTSNRARVTVLKVSDGQHVDFYNKESPYFHLATHFNEVIEQRIPDRQLLAHFNLILVSLDLWNEINSKRATWIKDCPSILVIKHHHDLPRDVEQQVVREAEK
ncbi:MAG: cation:proton antiporter [Bacteroidota bacterium]|jgi:Kef-type K+ transport system membrane component KefB|nr:MAG: cation/H(+) antiporter [Bacteroidota bacterium]